MLTFLVVVAIIGGFIANKDQRLQSFLFGAALGMVVAAVFFLNR